MDYGCNGLVKIHFITVSQISQEGQCKTLHHGRTNKILFRSHWMMRAAAHFDFMRFCTHIRYTHTLCVCVESQAIAMQPNDILLELAQIRESTFIPSRAYRCVLGFIAQKAGKPQTAAASKSD
jgi:hypothetical protein